MNPSKRQELPTDPSASTGLSMVATPIGNLEDLSPRARRTLESAELVLAEDTRVARSLYQALGVETHGRRFERCDRFREGAEGLLSAWIEAAREGRRLIFVSDAGTPGISDPGAAVARRFREEGIPVHVIPGPSAVAAFLSGAGFESNEFRFFGFFPRSEDERRRLGTREFGTASPTGVRIWFEAPSRIEACLEFWSRISESGDFPPIRLVAAKEISKWHERWIAGDPAQVLAEFRQLMALDSGFTSGEWVIGAELRRIEKAQLERKVGEDGDITQDLMNKIFDFSSELPVKSSELARAVSQAFGVDRDVAYRELLARRKKDS